MPVHTALGAHVSRGSSHGELVIAVAVLSMGMEFFDETEIKQFDVTTNYEEHGFKYNMNKSASALQVQRINQKINEFISIIKSTDSTPSNDN